MTWEHWSRDEQETSQMALLRRLLRRQILPFSPFYRARFKKLGLDPRTLRRYRDLQRIPFTSKQDLLTTPEHPDGSRAFVLQPSAELMRKELPLRDRLGCLLRRICLGKERLEQRLRGEYGPSGLIFTTGRSTGSVPFVLTQYDHRLLLDVGQRIVNILRLEPGRDRVFNAFPYAPHLAFWQVAFAGLASGVLTLNTGGGLVMGGTRLLAALERFQPTLVVAMPGYFYHLLRLAHERRMKLSSLRTVALGGENVPAGLRRKVVELLEALGAHDVRVVSVLGFTEARQCWTECPGGDRTGFHTYPDLGLFEIIDPKSGGVLEPGKTGELVFSNLDGRGSLVLRYRTGDIVEGGLTLGACPGCGRTVPRLGSSIRRVSNLKSLDIGKVKGTLVNLNALHETLTGDPEIEEWQLEIAKRNNDPFETDELRLYCALRGEEEPESFKQRIQDLIQEKAEVHLNAIRIEPLARLLKRVGMEKLTKEQRIRDTRQQAAAPLGRTPR